MTSRFTMPENHVGLMIGTASNRKESRDLSKIMRRRESPMMCSGCIGRSHPCAMSRRLVHEQTQCSQSWRLRDYPKSLNWMPCCMEMGGVMRAISVAS